MALFSDEDQDVRMSAAYSTARIGRPALKPLISALKDGSNDIKIGAAFALGEMGDPEAIEPLKGLLDDPNNNVNIAAKGAVEKIEERNKR